MRYSRPRRLGYVIAPPSDDEQLVYLMPLPDGPPLVLQGSAAVIWLAATEADDVCDEVARQLGLAPDDIVGDVEAYLEVLVNRGLLDQAGRGGRSTAGP